MACRLWGAEARRAGGSRIWVSFPGGEAATERKRQDSAAGVSVVSLAKSQRALIDPKCHLPDVNFSVSWVNSCCL